MYHLISSKQVLQQQNPYINKKGEVNDIFVKRVQEEVLKNASDETKLLNKQRLDVINKIDKVNNAEELKNLLKENEDFLAKTIYEDKSNFIDAITEKNYKSIQEGIKNSSLDSLEFERKFHELNIQSCWDKEAKKFVRPETLDEKYFKNIENATSGMKLKNVGKSALKGAGIGLAVALIFSGVFKLLQNKNRQA